MLNGWDQANRPTGNVSHLENYISRVFPLTERFRMLFRLFESLLHCKVPRLATLPHCTPERHLLAIWRNFNNCHLVDCWVAYLQALGNVFETSLGRTIEQYTFFN